MAKVWWEHRHYYLEWKGRWGACVHLITETDGVPGWSAAQSRNQRNT